MSSPSVKYHVRVSIIRRWRSKHVGILLVQSDVVYGPDLVSVIFFSLFEMALTWCNQGCSEASVDSLWCLCGPLREFLVIRSVAGRGHGLLFGVRT